MKVKNIFTCSIFTILANNCFSQVKEIFPNSNECKKIIKKCENRADLMCNKRICGTELAQYNLELKLDNSDINQHSFRNIFTLEDKVKKELSDFKLYNFRTIDETTYTKEINDINKEVDTRRINIVVGEKNKLIKVVIY